MTTIDEKLDNLEREVFDNPYNLNPNLLIQRFKEIESFTEFDLGKQPVLAVYEDILTNIKRRTFEINQDIKLVKMYSLTHNLVWYNNILKNYDGDKINFEPLITLMHKKNRYYYLCSLKLHQIKLEFDTDIETLFKYVINSAYNSMIDSQITSMMGSDKNIPLIVKEHSVKVDEVNHLFEELGVKVNSSLTNKFPEDMLDMFSRLQLSI